MARDIDETRNSTGHAPQRRQTIANFVEAAIEAEGLSLDSLRPMSRLVVRTRNTLYRLVVLGPGPSVLVQGGCYFPEAREAQLCGSSLGGSMLKTYWIGVGFRMELSGPTEHVVTSPVRSIEVERDSVHGPF